MDCVKVRHFYFSEHKILCFCEDCCKSHRNFPQTCYNRYIRIYDEGNTMQVIKRDGTVVDYDRAKIAIAIGKANAEMEAKERASGQ